MEPLKYSAIIPTITHAAHPQQASPLRNNKANGLLQNKLAFLHRIKLKKMSVRSNPRSQPPKNYQKFLTPTSIFFFQAKNKLFDP